MPLAEDATAPATAGVRLAASTSLAALALIVGLFFLWGVANNLNDILIKQFKNAFALSDFQAGLVQSAFYLGYFLLGIPAGVCMRRFGFKGAILIGLLLYALGALLFWPAAATQTYAIFLCGLFVIASGLSFLETSANPLVTVLGPPEGGARRLNFAQSFNPLGSIAGVLIGRNFIFNGVEHTPQQLSAMTPAARHAYFVSQSLTVQTPYLVIAGVVIAFAVMIALVRFPARGEDAADHASRRRRAVLLRGRAGGRVELPDPLHAGHVAGHAGTARGRLPDGVAGAVHAGTFRGHRVDARGRAAQVAGAVRGHQRGAVRDRRRAAGPAGAVRTGTRQLLHVGDVPDHLRAGRGGLRRQRAQTRCLAAGDGHRRRRGVDRPDGRGVGHGWHRPCDGGAAGLFRRGVAVRDAARTAGLSHAPLLRPRPQGRPGADRRVRTLAPARKHLAGDRGFAARGRHPRSGNLSRRQPAGDDHGCAERFLA